MGSFIYDKKYYLQHTMLAITWCVSEVHMAYGLIKDIVDTSTGATLNFHKMESFSTDTRTNAAYVHINSYVDRAAQETQKNHIMATSLTLSGVVDYSINYLYARILAEESVLSRSIEVE